MSRNILSRKSFRIVYALFIAIMVIAGAVGPAYAQRADPAIPEMVDFKTRGDYGNQGIYSPVDDFVLVCPGEDKVLKDPEHPCNNDEFGRIGQISRFDDFVLVCPIGDKQLGNNHPCDSRSAQIKDAAPEQYVSLYRSEGGRSVQFRTPDSYVLTCPTLPVQETGHPCSEQ